MRSCTESTQEQESHTGTSWRGLAGGGGPLHRGCCPSSPLLTPPECKQSPSFQASHREGAHSPALAVPVQWLMGGSQTRIFNHSWSLLLFAVGACHEKSKSLFLFIFCTLKGINLLWRGDGLVFLKCLLCYYSSKKEISSALSRVSHSSLGGQRDIMFPLSELKTHSYEKVMGYLRSA